MEGPHAYERAVAQVLAIEGKDYLLLPTVAQNQMANDKAEAVWVYLNAEVSFQVYPIVVDYQARAIELLPHRFVICKIAIRE